MVYWGNCTVANQQLKQTKGHGMDNAFVAVGYGIFE
jgi:glycerol uptake facilitator-like aquaporin